MTESQTDACWVGFDLGGTKMLAAAFDSSFKVLGRKRKKTRGHEGSEAGLKRIIECIDGALKDGDVGRPQLRGIGIGCPGPLDLDRGIVFEAPNLGWSNVKVKDTLQNEFGCPVALLNDVDAGVYGEYRFGAGKNARCALGVFPGTGIGGGCVYEGRIIRGKVSSCMEIGHIQVMPDGPLCGCGQRGCLEAVASRLAISAAAAQAVYRGQAPNLRKIAGTDLSDIRSGALADSIAAGDKVVEKIVRDAAGQIGTAVGGLVHLVSPDVIVLGGGLVEAMPKLFAEAVEKSVKAWVLPSFVNSFKVQTAKLGDDAAAMGAAAWARETAPSAAIASH
jgi:glucokinase